jgi:hypothetical protein
MKVDPQEIVFIKENAPKAFPRLVQEGLEAQGIEIRREYIYVELSSIKDTYNPDIINEARRLLKAVKGVEYVKEASL